MRDRLALLTFAALLALSSCGGGGGGGSSVSSDLTETETQAETAQTQDQQPAQGYFFASAVKGLTVCAPATGECVQTDETGRFVFSRTPYSAGLTLEFSAGGVSIGNAKAMLQGEVFNPAVVAEGDALVGSAIGAFLHALAGDEAGSAPVIDLTGVKAEADAGSLEEALKAGKEVIVKTADGRVIKVSKAGVIICADEACTDGKEVKWGKNWTVIYYGAADNNLSSFIELDLEEMEKAGVPESVNLVAFYDESGNGTYSVLRYDQERGGFVKEKGPQELNSASPETFAGMVSYLMGAYPAQKYVLIIGSHGDGVRSTPVRFVAYDSNPYGVLYNWEFLEALKFLKEAGYPAFNLIGFDECLAGSSELLWVVKDFVKNGVIASEYAEPASGWNYYYFLEQAFGEKEDPSPDEVARAAVDAYGKHYGSYYEGNEELIEKFSNITLAYYPADFIKTYGEGVKEFSQAALNNLWVLRTIGKVRAELVPVESADNFARIDAYSLWERLYQELNNGWDDCVAGSTEGDSFSREKNCQALKEGLEKILSVKESVYAYRLKDYSYGVGEGLPSIFYPFEKSSDYDFYFQQQPAPDGYYNPFSSSLWPAVLDYLFVLEKDGELEVTVPDYAR